MRPNKWDKCVIRGATEHDHILREITQHFGRRNFAGEMTIGRPEGNRSIIEQYVAFF